MSWQLGAFTILAFALAAGFAWYERTRPDARVVALVATLAAFAALGRIAFAAVPNVKPTTDIVLIAGYALGGGPGFVVGALAGLTSNFFFGQGPWTPWQMAAWGVTGLFGAGLAWVATVGWARPAASLRARRAAALPPRRETAGPARRPAALPPRRETAGPPTPNRWWLAVVCGLAGFAFTVVQDVGDWVTYSDHSLAQLGVYVAKGVGFDFVHAAGCVAFALMFGPALARSIGRFSLRLHVTWAPPTGAIVPVVAALAVSTGWLAGQPARARAASTPAGYLVSAQNGDGGFGQAPGSASSQLYAGWAALGLAAAGYDPQVVRHGGSSLAAYLVAGEGGDRDPGSIERTILALRAAGLAAGAMVGRLERDLRPDGSVSEQVNLTAFAVLALRAAGVPVSARTLAWLGRQQDSDGGFGFATKGSGSDVDDTGAVLEALGANARAVHFIEGHENGDGGFPSQAGASSNAQSTAWAVQGLIAAGASPTSLGRPLSYLRSLIAADGHVRYATGSDQTPVWVTAEALMALDGKPLPLAPASGPAALKAARASVTRTPKAAKRRAVARRGSPSAVGGLAGDLGALEALAFATVG